MRPNPSRRSLGLCLLLATSALAGETPAPAPSLEALAKKEADRLHFTCKEAPPQEQEELPIVLKATSRLDVTLDCAGLRLCDLGPDGKESSGDERCVPFPESSLEKTYALLDAALGESALRTACESNNKQVEWNQDHEKGPLLDCTRQVLCAVRRAEGEEKGEELCVSLSEPGQDIAGITVDEEYVDIHFATPRAGWVLAASGRLLATKDGGARWKRLPGPAQGGTAKGSGPFSRVKRRLVNKELLAASTSATDEERTRIGPRWTAVAFWNANQGFAIGSAGRLVRTEDGGASWGWSKVGTLARGRDLQAACVVGKKGFGVVAGPGGTLLVTRDGAKTWSQPPVAPRWKAVRSLACLDERSWLMVGDAALLTRDGGATWEPVPTPEDMHLSQAWWLTKKAGFLAGTPEGADSEQLVVTSDGFTSTDQVELSLPVTRVAFLSPSRGWALSEGRVHAMTPPRKLGREGWTFQPLGPLAPESGEAGARDLRTFELLLDLHFTSPRQGFAVGVPSLLLGTKDGGKTWAPLNVAP